MFWKTEESGSVFVDGKGRNTHTVSGTSFALLKAYSSDTKTTYLEIFNNYGKNYYQ